MFGRKKDAAKISDRTPVFHVRYIGNTETYVANGKGCSHVPVQRLWDNSPGEKHLRKVAVHINPSGITLTDAEKRETSAMQSFRIEDISFCNTDSAVNQRIFSWICRNVPENRLDCHAVLCSSQQKAQTMAVVLSRAFQIAYKDWRAHNRNRQNSRPLSELSREGRQNESNPSSAGAPNRSGSGMSGLEPSAAKSTPPESVGKVLNVAETRSVAAAAVGSPSLEKKNSREESMTYKNEHIFREEKDAQQPMTSLFFEQQPTFTGFMNSSILDPEVEEAILQVENLTAEFDLEESD